MEKPIEDLLKEIYAEDISLVNTPACPVQLQDGIKADTATVSPGRKIRQGLLKAAAVLILIGTVTLLSLDHKPAALVIKITEISVKYKLSERIPAGIKNIQKAFADYINLTI